jgi:hypothetical protein
MVAAQDNRLLSSNEREGNETQFSRGDEEATFRGRRPRTVKIDVKPYFDSAPQNT